MSYNFFNNLKNYTSNTLFTTWIYIKYITIIVISAIPSLILLSTNSDFYYYCDDMPDVFMTKDQASLEFPMLRDIINSGFKGLIHKRFLEGGCMMELYSLPDNNIKMVHYSPESMNYQKRLYLDSQFRSMVDQKRMLLHTLRLRPVTFEMAQQTNFADQWEKDYRARRALISKL
jgi:hypothetical protein